MEGRIRVGIKLDFIVKDYGTICRGKERMKERVQSNSKPLPCTALKCQFLNLNEVAVCISLS